MLIVIFVIMLLPLAQKNLPFLKSGELYGYFDEWPDIDFSWNFWWSGTYRDGKDKFFNDHVGYRPDLIRLERQVEYSLFDKLHFYPDMVGANQVLWDCSYAEAYLGLDYIGYESMHNTLVKLKRIQDTLGRLNKSLILINAPCKGFFYPGNLPPHLTGIPKKVTNLETCIRICDSIGINQIDFNGWFVSLKNTTPRLLYPRFGVHWSVYGAALAADSMIRCMERVMKISMPHPVIDNITEQHKAEFTDDDLGKPLNLIFPFGEETYSYPHIKYAVDATRKKPNVIYIGDSFFCQWMYLCIPENVNIKWQYWRRFLSVNNKDYPYWVNESPKMKDIDWVGELNKTDCVVLIYTARNLPTFGSEFIDHAYAHYFPNGN